jgi:hypothetical protein
MDSSFTFIELAVSDSILGGGRADQNAELQIIHPALKDPASFNSSLNLLEK